jgi:aspartokinase-like uncharacterized kinase
MKSDEKDKDRRMQDESCRPETSDPSFIPHPSSLPPGPIAVKVGGSLFDLPDLIPRLTSWLRGLPSEAILLVPGGGAVADFVRRWDGRHHLGAERAHWLALYGLSLNARLVSACLPGSAIANEPEDCFEHWRRGLVSVLDPYCFALFDKGKPGCLPASWDVTSDSIAARAAKAVRATALILLKSVSVPKELTLGEAGRLGFVDTPFAEVATELRVQCLNFREAASSHLVD